MRTRSPRRRPPSAARARFRAILTVEILENRESPTDWTSLLASSWLTAERPYFDFGSNQEPSSRPFAADFADPSQQSQRWTDLPLVSASQPQAAAGQLTTAAAPEQLSPIPQTIPNQPFDGRQFFVALQTDFFTDPFADPFKHDAPIADGGGGGMPTLEQPNITAPPEPGGGGGSGADGGGGGAAGTPTGSTADTSDAGGPSTPPAAGTTTPTPSTPSGTDSGSGSAGGGGAPLTPQARPSLVQNFGGRPGLNFERNLGQTAAPVQFLARAAGHVVFLTPGSAVLELARPQTGPDLGPLARSAAPTGRTVDVVAVNFVGANPNARLTGQDELPTRSNYFTGANRFIDIANYSRVHVSNLWSGVDASYYTSQQGKLEFDFTVAPGASPLAVQLEFQGARTLSLDLAGNLVLDTDSGGRVVHQKPTLYQTINGQQQTVTGSYVLLGTNRVGFVTGPYNTAYPLIIDPVMDYSTYIGGSGDDEGLAIAVDGAGNTYVTGKTLSTNFPLQNPFQSSFQGGTDVFVSKLNALGNALIYATYVGGSGADQGNGIAVDLAGNAYVVGTTGSTNFPTSTGAYQTTLGGSTDAFVFQLSTSGDSLHSASYFGGSLTDTGTAIAVDANGQAFFTGDTAGGTFPTTTGAYDTTYNGGTTDAFIAAVNATGTARVYSTYLGGGGADTAYGIGLDPNGNAYVTGSTDSTGASPFPTANAFQSTFVGGTSDAFLSKINPSGTALGYST